MKALSAGDVLRSHIQRQTDIGKQAAKVIEQGCEAIEKECEADKSQAND
jgi:adenylate kinase family enzyme